MTIDLKDAGNSFPFSTQHALSIARAGLEHWHTGSGQYASELLDGVMQTMRNEISERELVAMRPGGLNDARWISVICTTCSLALYAYVRIGATDGMFPFRQIDAFACRCKHGGLDRFTALASDDVWNQLQAPFDWMCACAVVPLLRMDVPRPAHAMTPGLSRISPQRLEKAHGWMERSPESAFHLL